MGIEVLAEGVEATDERLCSQLADADQNALAQLYDRHGSAVFGMALRVTRSRESAEDIVQAGFLKLWCAPDLYSRQRGSFRSWFARLIINLAIDQVRRESCQERLGSAISHQLAVEEPAADPFDVVERRLRAGATREAMSRLPSSQRQVLELAYFRDCTVPEIAAHTALPVTTIKGRMRLALQKMRVEIPIPPR